MTQTQRAVLFCTVVLTATATVAALVAIWAVRAINTVGEYLTGTSAPTLPLDALEPAGWLLLAPAFAAGALWAAFLHTRSIGRSNLARIRGTLTLGALSVAALALLVLLAGAR